MQALRRVIFALVATCAVLSSFYYPVVSRPIEEESRRSVSKVEAEIAERGEGNDLGVPLVGGDGIPVALIRRVIDFVTEAAGAEGQGFSLHFESWSVPSDPRIFWGADPSPPLKSL